MTKEVSSRMKADQYYLKKKKNQSIESIPYLKGSDV